MRKFLILCLMLALMAPAALAQDDEEMELEAWVCPEGYEGQTLSIFNWSTYIAEDTIPNFEEACGVTINYDIYESNEQMLTRIRQGNPGYDLVVPTGGSTLAVMIREELVIPLDFDLIPNRANLVGDLVDLPYDPDGLYSVPYQWGTTGVGYNTEVFPDGITSWDQVWEHTGNVAWIDDMRGMLGLALHLMDLDPNTEDPDEILAARDFLLERGGNVVTVAGDDGQVLLERGDVDIAIEYSGDILMLAEECECDTYAYVVPDEGSNVWVDTLAIPVDAPNPELANIFIDYILHPQVGADISNYTAYASPNQAAISLGLILEEFLNEPAIYPDEEKLERLFSIVVVSAEAEQFYNDAWDELLILLGS